MAKTRSAGAPEATEVRRSARLRGQKAAVDGFAPTPTPEHRVTKTKAAPKKPTKLECTICTRTLSLSSFPKYLPTDSCDHWINTCKACLKAWITSQLDSTTYDKITCPECPQLMKSSDIEEHATKAVFARFDELERRGIADNTPGWRWCLDLECKAGQVHLPLLEAGSTDEPKIDSTLQKKDKESRNVMDRANQKAKKPKSETAEDICTCKKCGARACVPCDRTYHEGETCTEYKKRVAKLKKGDKASEKIIKEVSKPCPGCSRPIQRNGGCDHMACTQCGTRFCYLCLVTYDIINRNGHGHGYTYAKPGRIDPRQDLIPQMQANFNAMGNVFQGAWAGLAGLAGIGGGAAGGGAA